MRIIGQSIQAEAQQLADADYSGDSEAANKLVVLIEPHLRFWGQRNGIPLGTFKKPKAKRGYADASNIDDWLGMVFHDLSIALSKARAQKKPIENIAGILTNIASAKRGDFFRRLYRHRDLISKLREDAQRHQTAAVRTVRCNSGQSESGWYKQTVEQRQLNTRQSLDTLIDRAKVRLAVGKLDQLQRSLIGLRYQNDGLERRLTIPEIAKELGVLRSIAKRWVNKAENAVAAFITEGAADLSELEARLILQTHPWPEPLKLGDSVQLKAKDARDKNASQPTVAV